MNNTVRPQSLDIYHSNFRQKMLMLIDFLISKLSNVWLNAVTPGPDFLIYMFRTSPVIDELICSIQVTASYCYFNLRYSSLHISVVLPPITWYKDSLTFVQSFLFQIYYCIDNYVFFSLKVALFWEKAM